MDYALMQVADETQNITRLEKYNLNGQFISLVKRNARPFSEVELFSPIDLEKIYTGIYYPSFRQQQEQYAKITVVEKDSFEAAKGVDNPLVMNFASATHKGGGFLTGAHAQEESLCRCSTLYASLTAEGAQGYYDYNRSLYSPLYSDYMLLSNNVCVFRDVSLNLLEEPYNVAVATVPAPNLRSMKVNKPDLTIMMLRRIRYFLSMAAKRGHKNLILGAWGCGAFRHNPYDVAQYFHKVLIDEGFAVLFDAIVFAIVKSQDNLQAFQEVFSCKNNEAIQELRRKEDKEIMMHLRSIEEIVKMKCSRCDNLLGCLGCNLRELQQDIEHAKKMMGFQNE